MAANSLIDDGLTFLAKPRQAASLAIAVIFGSDAYLKREVLHCLRRGLSSKDDDLPEMYELAGKTAELADVIDEVWTPSLFDDSLRLVVIDDADDFIKKYREKLESYVERPAETGLLILIAKSWPGNTRLAKAHAAAGGLAVRCEPPKEAQLRRWLQQSAKLQNVALPKDALDLLLDMAPRELGILQQELTKLATIAGEGGTITPTTVQQNVGGGRLRQTWDMIDAAANGDATEALRQLDRLVGAGEDPLAVLPQMAGVLRRFNIAGRLIEAAERAGQRPNLRAALADAGVVHFKLDEAERQLRQMGRHRVRQLLTWLLEGDLALKGSHSRGDAALRMLELIILRLSQFADTRQRR